MHAPSASRFGARPTGDVAVTRRAATSTIAMALSAVLLTTAK